MTDFQAALGVTQLKRLEWVIHKKVERAGYYNRRIREVLNDKVLPPHLVPHATHVYMFYSARFRTGEMRDKAVVELEKKGVETRISFPCIHLQPLYQELFGYRRGALPVSEGVSDTILCLPMYPHIGVEEQEYVLSSLREVFK